jgi:hypothetical protein
MSKIKVYKYPKLTVKYDSEKAKEKRANLTKEEKTEKLMAQKDWQLKYHLEHKGKSFDSFLSAQARFSLDNARGT